jgi:hypothetical protein
MGLSMMGEVITELSGVSCSNELVVNVDSFEHSCGVVLERPDPSIARLERGLDEDRI